FNWASAIPAPGADTTITFVSAPSWSSVNNLGSPFVLNALTFNVGLTLTGGQLDFRTNSISAPPQITQSASAPVTITNALALTNDLNVNGTGDLTLSGVITGPGL